MFVLNNYYGSEIGKGWEIGRRFSKTCYWLSRTDIKFLYFLKINKIK